MKEMKPGDDIEQVSAGWSAWPPKVNLTWAYMTSLSWAFKEKGEQV